MTTLMRSRSWAILLLLLLSVGTAQSLPQATPAQPPPEPEAPPAGEVPESLHLLVGRSLVITSPTRIKRMSIADPDIADANLVTPNQILVNGKKPGGVSLVIWDELDQSQTFDIFVDLDILEISRKIREVFPEEPVLVEASKDVAILSGRISSEAIADKLLQIVSSATPKVISLMQVPTPPTKGEILLEVRFAEIDRTALSQYGFNLFSTGATNSIGSTTTGQFGRIQEWEIEDTFKLGPEPFPKGSFTTKQTISDVLNIFIFRPDLHLGAVIRALQQRNLLQILAEPNLLTQTGKEASFLAGGEFPFPVPQAVGAGGGGIFTIQFKEFGVRLTFTPTLTVDGMIHLKVRPEVSTLDFANAVSFSGALIPALSTRRVETEMDLKDGQSFAIAGLVDDRVTRSVQKVPFLGDIPILGYLFRSWTHQKNKTELLVLVTPRLVKPAPEQALPKQPQFPKEFLPPASPGEKDQ